MRRIATALDQYHEQYGIFPPAHLGGDRGVSMHSWRILILPFLSEQSLFDEYRFDEPWNGPSNRKLESRMPECFRCPSHGHHGDPVGEFVTNYVVVVDPTAVFRGSTSVSKKDIKDGSAVTILVVDVNQEAVNWMAPSDITMNKCLSLFGEDPPDSNHEGGTTVAFVDGHTRFVPQSTSPDLVRALTTSRSGDDMHGFEF